MRPMMTNTAILNMVTREPTHGNRYIVEYASLSSKTVGPMLVVLTHLLLAGVDVDPLCFLNG
jgi:hypothetical protein